VTEEAHDFEAKLKRLSGVVGDKLDADVYLYSGPISEPTDDRVVDDCMGRTRRKNVVLILSTYGGDPDAAYRIARCFQRNYSHFTVMVAGFCKSAGTLLLIGANQLVLFEQAELGPLDIQLRKADELLEKSSGLTPMQALTVLNQRALSVFEEGFLKLKLDLLLGTKTAADIASSLAVGLYQPIFGQVDPMRLGEMDRAVRIAFEYGTRLDANSKNLKEGALERLVAKYPSHEFVIDAEEAGEIFKQVRPPTNDEKALVRHIKPLTRSPLDDGHRAVRLYLNGEANDQNQNDSGEPDGSAEGDREGAERGGSGNLQPLPPHGEAEPGRES
jgi:hypothetical protein